MRLALAKKAADSRRGSAIVIALIIVAMLGALGASYLRVTTSVMDRQASDVDNVQAFYLAEAGLAEAFQAVRVGRTGQVGSQAAPAVYGGGLLWVDVTETADDQIRLESTALYGMGRATLAQVVEPVEIPLGFFSDEDLVVESVLLVDGFDSGEATYEQEIMAVAELQAYAERLAGLVGQAVAEEYISIGGPQAAHKLAWQANMGPEQEAELTALMPDLHEAHLAGTLFPTSTPSDVDVVPIDSDEATFFGTGGTYSSDPVLSTDSVTIDTSTGEPISTETATTVPTIPDDHTTSSGLLASNGSVHFASPSGEPVEIWGDVIPGPGGSVSVSGDVQVTGSTEPRSVPVNLPAVEVPNTAMAGPVRHEGLLPMLVSTGTSGHERIEVAADAELILRGPSTVVIGELVLEPGAVLTLDTRDGNVELYVTGGMDLQPGSVVTTSSDFPDELSIQVAPIPSGADGAPVKLEATSQFHGTIYAPETEVSVGGDFEVYGGIVARKLNIGAGAKLHFDNAEYEGSPIPRLVSWKIVEIPSAVRARRGDPYAVLGVEPGSLAELSDSHDLAAVMLTIEYLDHSGIQRSYSGTEDQFDWSDVAEVLNVERVATRTREEGAGGTTDPPPTEEPPSEPAEVRTDVAGYVDGFPSTMNGKDLVDLLVPLCPLSTDEWALIDASGLGGGQYTRLVDEDQAAGGTGG